MASKLQSPRQLAEKFLAKFGSAPGSRECEFMRLAFCKGYAAAQRRVKPRVEYVTRYVGGAYGPRGCQ